MEIGDKADVLRSLLRSQVPLRTVLYVYCVSLLLKSYPYCTKGCSIQSLVKYGKPTFGFP